MVTKMFGPPGTGKTTVLIDRLDEELANGTDPSRMAFLTFTRAARVEALTRTGKKDTDFPFLKTIHSICYHQLGINKDQIVTPKHVWQFGRKIGIKLTGSELDPWIEEFERSSDQPTKDDWLLQANHRGRHRKIMLKEAMKEMPQEIDYKYAVWFTTAYRDWKAIMGYVDYTDLLTQYTLHGGPLDIDVLFVDEAQDLSPLQWDVVRILGANAKRKYYGGDDDQAIFHWAGADSSVFQNIYADKVEILNQSFRVPRAVHALAQSIVGRIRHRVQKTYLPTQVEGLVTEAGVLSSLSFDKKTFILFRNHYRGIAIADCLKEDRIPFIGKGSPLSSADLRAGLYALHCLAVKKEAASEYIRKLYNLFPKEGRTKIHDELTYVGDYFMPNLPSLMKEKKTLSVDQVFIRRPTLGECMREFSKSPTLCFLTDYIRIWGLLNTAVPKLEIMSIHQSKGREVNTVIIDPEMSKAVWQSMIQDPDDEHRVRYVGITRAKEEVKFMAPDGTYSYRF